MLREWLHITGIEVVEARLNYLAYMHLKLMLFC
jgi:hypothetical protein